MFSFNEDKEKEKGGDRWSRLSSMVEAKLAAQYLFDTAAEVKRVPRCFNGRMNSLICKRRTFGKL